MSLWLNLGQLATRAGRLLPTITNLTSWLVLPTADGKTLANSKGADADLTDVNCLSFDGVNDYVDFNHTLIDQQDFVVEWEGIMGAVSNNDAFWSLFDDSGSNRGSYIRYEHTNTRIFARIGSQSIFSSSITLAENDVVKLTTTISNSGTKASAVIVVNGVTTNLFTDQSLNTAPEFDGTGRIGRLSPLSTSVFAGKINSFKITQGEVNVHFPLAEGSGTKVYDVSGNGNHGTITGATWSTEDGIESWNHEYGFSSAFANLDGADNKQLKLPITGLDQSTFDMTLWLEGTDRIASASKWFLDNGAVFNNRGVEIKGTTANEILFITYFSGGRVLLRTPTTVTDNQMYKFDVHFESGNSYLVIDGVKGTVDTTIFTQQFTGNEDDVYLFGKTDGVNAARGIIYKLNINGSEKVLTSAELIGSPARYNFPALNTKTKQVATFDGAADYIDTNTPNTSKGSYEVTFVPTLVNDTMIIAGGRPSTGRRTYIAVDNQSVALKLSAGIGDQFNNTFRGTTTLTLGTRYRAKLTWDDATNNAELFLDQFDGNGFVLESATSYGSTASDADIIVGALNNSGTISNHFSGEIHNFTFKDGNDNTVIEYDFQSDIGTTTVQDLSANNNDGTVTVGAGGLATFWGTRVADASGSLVSADYATGNTSISNPAGFVHNNSECGVELGFNSIYVSGAGESTVNGTYTAYTGSLTDITPKANTTVYNKGFLYLYQVTNSQWRIETDFEGDNNWYNNTATTDLPPKSGWTAGVDIDPPAPTLSYGGSFTAAQLFAIDNSTATQTFIRKDNGNIKQILDYSAALTGDDLTRTRNYVG